MARRMAVDDDDARDEQDDQDDGARDEQDDRDEEQDVLGRLSTLEDRVSRLEDRLGGGGKSEKGVEEPPAELLAILLPKRKERQR